MTAPQWAVVVGWFALASYVMYRCFTTAGVDYDVLFAAWCGGVLSYACVAILWTRDETPK